MQEVHPLNTGINGSGGNGRLFGDRRLRPHSHHPNNQQVLKCPRCESLNTKFCYYNNYNLSQPRHFCKNCRRYWTKGGVLRNVPVGGGCRKSKRSYKSKSKSSSKGTNSQSSSESSNGAAAAAAAPLDIITTTSTVSASTIVGSVGGGGMYQISETENNFLGLRNLDPLIEDSTDQAGDGGILFPGEIGRFMSLMNNSSTSSNNNIDHHNNNNSQLSYDEGATTASFSQFLQDNTTGVHDWDLGKLGGSHEVDDDLLQHRGSSGGLASLDWHQTAENEHHGLFDLPSTVDHQDAAYWSQSASTNSHHWSDNTNDHSLFLP